MAIGRASRPRVIQLFPLVWEAVEKVLPVSRLRWVAFAHAEADECGG